MKLHKLIGILMAAVIFFSAAACTPKATPTPTVEPTVIESPTETMEPIVTETETPMVTETLETTVVPGADTNQGQSTPPAGTTPNAPANTGGQPASSAPDKYQYVTQNLPDSYQVRPNVSVTITWTVKNIGTTAWDKNYSLRFFAGPDVKNTYIPFIKTVAANAATELSATFTTPAQPGNYELWFKLANAQSQNFGDVNFIFTVTNTPNNTIKPKASPTANALPTP